MDYPSDTRSEFQTKPRHAEPTMLAVMPNVGLQWKGDGLTGEDRPVLHFLYVCMLLAGTRMKVTKPQCVKIIKIYRIHAFVKGIRESMYQALINHSISSNKQMINGMPSSCNNPLCSTVKSNEADTSIIQT